MGALPGRTARDPEASTPPGPCSEGMTAGESGNGCPVRIEWTRRRHHAVFGVAALLAVLATFWFAMQWPPMWSSSAAVVARVPQPEMIWTQARIADSRPVLLAASENDRTQSFRELVRHVKVTVASPDPVLVVTVTGWTGPGAQRAAAVVARRYVAFAMSPGSPGGPVDAAVLDPYTPATRTSVSAWVSKTAGFGMLAGLVLGVIAALTLKWVPRRQQSGL